MNEPDRSGPDSDRITGIPDLPFNNLFLISGLVHGANKFWMYLFTVFFFITGYVGYQLFAFMPLVARLMANGYSQADLLDDPHLMLNSEALGLDKNIVLAIELGMFVFAFLGFFVGLRSIHRKTLTSVLTGFGRFRFGRFWFSFALWAGFIGLFTLIAWMSGTEDMQVVFQPQGFLVSALIFICLMPLQVGVEEVIFRGYLVQGMAQVFRNGLVPVLITSLLFGLAHMGNPEIQKHGWEIMLPYYTLNALFLGVITLLDEGLELAFGMHLANNLVSGLLVTTPNSVIQPYTVFSVPAEHPQTEIMVWLAMAVTAFLLYRYKYRWTNFTLIIK